MGQNSHSRSVRGSARIFVLIAAALLLSPTVWTATASPAGVAGVDATALGTEDGGAATAGGAPPVEPPRFGEAPGAEPDGAGSTLGMLVRVAMALGAIILLAYLLLHKGLGSLSGRLSKGRLVRVVDRVGLEPKKTLYVVEVAGRYYLIGTSDNGVNCLATLSSEQTKEAFDAYVRKETGTHKADAAAAASRGGDNG